MLRRPWKFAVLALPVACSSPSVPYQHERPIVEDGGSTMLWAGEEDEWFEVTDARIDPELFQFGIGKDRIPSIDEPVFVSVGDPLFAERGLDLDTPVLGVVVDGEARAYPVALMDMHEVVNDQFGVDSYAVLW